MSALVNPARVRQVREGRRGTGPVVYWMSRDQRVDDNWALIHACQRGAKQGIVVVFCLAPGFLGATMRQYDFMLRGIQQVEVALRERGIPFVLLLGEPPLEMTGFIKTVDAAEVVCDFDPLRVKRQWLAEVSKAVDVPMVEVDAHNVVPAWVVSQKQEYAARTIRSKIHKHLNEFLEPFPQLPHCVCSLPDFQEPDWEYVWNSLTVDGSVEPTELTSGSMAAKAHLSSFLRDKLSRYASHRNDPNAGAVSGLSPYFHFGQLAPQRAALDAARAGSDENVESFLEELVVRRELSDNFCLYNPRYDSLQGAAGWAQETLAEHRDDHRKYGYDLERLENARTHSRLWNAAQMQLLMTGTMHGYMRMYWAKKILEWTASPEKAVSIAIYLNDKYALDGRDPNGYVGILWSIAGVHDRAWKERPVYGKIRYMNENGCRRKFDVDQYILNQTVR